MRRLALALLVALLAIPLSACGGGGGGGGDGFFGTLVVCNDISSFEDIVEVEVEDEFGTVISYGSFIGPDDCDFIDEFFPDTYIVRVLWSDFTADEELVDIFDGEETEVTFIN